MLLKNKNVHLAKQRALLGNWNLKGGGESSESLNKSAVFIPKNVLFLAAGCGLLTRLGKRRGGGTDRGSVLPGTDPHPPYWGHLLGHVVLYWFITG